MITTVSTPREILGSSVSVEPLPEDIARIARRINFSNRDLPDIGAHVGDTIRIYYDGTVFVSYPAQVTDTNWLVLSQR
jgi:hypothetical protein